MYYWCIVDMLKIATHVYTTIPTYIKNIIFRNYIVSTIHIKKIRIEYPRTHPHTHAPPSHTHAYPHRPAQTRTHPTHTH